MTIRDCTDSRDLNRPRGSKIIHSQEPSTCSTPSTLGNPPPTHINPHSPQKRLLEFINLLR
jgi:hypothetical protein